MRTIIPYSSLKKGSWAEDLTPPQEVRQKYMYVQSIGHFYATPRYNVIGRSNLHSYLLLYTQEGEGTVEYDGRKIRLLKHCSVILNCDHPHSYYCSPDMEWDLYWIHFSGTCIDGYLNEIMANWDVNTSDIPGDFFHRIYNHYRIDPSLSAAIQCSTDIINLCSDFLIALRQNQQSSAVSKSPVVRNAMTYIEEKINDELSLDDLCSSLNVSKFYLSHIFKEQTGFSPNEYLITLRLSNAKSLLRSTSIAVSEISEQCGFNGSSYFIQAFKKREGMTPLQYRKYFLQLSSV